MFLSCYVNMVTTVNKNLHKNVGKKISQNASTIKENTKKAATHTRYEVGSRNSWLRIVSSGKDKGKI